MDYVEPLDLLCVTCKAQAGERCRWFWGLFARPSSHLSRIRTAIRYNDLQNTTERLAQWRP